MVAALLSRVIIVVCGILYPAYSSFKAVKSKSHREYTKWMMYWIVFALFQAAETLTDTFLPWIPLYYELKIVLVLWLVLPITQGSKQLYRMIIHPFLVKHEGQIDQCITQAGQQGLAAVRRLSREGINRAATTVVTSAIKGQAVITETLLRAQAEDQGQDQGQLPAPSSNRASSREHRASSWASSDSEAFEVIEEEVFTNGDDGPMVGDYQPGSRQANSSSDSAPADSGSHNYEESSASEMVYRKAH